MNGTLKGMILGAGLIIAIAAAMGAYAMASGEPMGFIQINILAPNGTTMQTTYGSNNTTITLAEPTQTPTTQTTPTPAAAAAPTQEATPTPAATITPTPTPTPTVTVTPTVTPTPTPIPPSSGAITATPIPGGYTYEAFAAEFNNESIWPNNKSYISPDGSHTWALIYDTQLAHSQWAWTQINFIIYRDEHLLGVVQGNNGWMTQLVSQYIYKTHQWEPGFRSIDMFYDPSIWPAGHTPAEDPAYYVEDDDNALQYVEVMNGSKPVFIPK